MLPKQKDIFKNIVLNGNKLQIRAWKTKDEKQYLIQKSVEDFNEDKLIELLVAPLVTDYDKYSFTDSEKLYLLTKIREISLGSDIDIAFTCPHCDNYQDITLNLNEIVKYSPESFHDVKIDDYLFKFKKGNIKKAKERGKGKKDVEQDFINLVSSIYEIQIKEDVYDTFTFDELYEFLDNLDTKIFNKLYNEYYDMVDSISFEYECKCQICGKKIKDTLDSIPNFLWD